MKKKRSRDLIIVAIAIAGLFMLTIILQNTGVSSKPNYSIDNTSNNGISVFYETLKQLGYPVEKTIKPVEKFDTNNIQIVVYNYNFDLEDEKVERWINEGGILVLLRSSISSEINYGVLEDEEYYVEVYSHGEGKIIYGVLDSITNYNLYMQGENGLDRKGAYELLKVIDKQDYDKIYFNESYFYAIQESKSLWSSLSTEQKIVCYQVLILLIAFFYYKGKRFGKPIPLYEEVERTENEYVYSAAALYKYAGCWDLATENYYKTFLRLINRRHDNWLEYWEEEQLPMFNKAQEIHDFMQLKETKMKAKNYVHIISSIEQLTDIFNRRRDLYWNQLKVNQ